MNHSDLPSLKAASQMCTGKFVPLPHDPKYYLDFLNFNILKVSGFSSSGCSKILACN